MRHLCVLIQLRGQFYERIIREDVPVKHNTAQVRVRSQVQSKHSQAIVVDACIREVN